MDKSQKPEDRIAQLERQVADLRDLVMVLGAAVAGLALMLVSEWLLRR
jgi:hypothetical protein